MLINKSDPKHWENRIWLLSSDIPKILVEDAQRLEDEEKRLREQLFVEDLNELICDVFAYNLRDSYAIEKEFLNSSIIKSSLIRQLNLDLPVWTSKFSNGEREAEATAMTLSLMNEKELTHEMIINAHGKLSDIHFSGRYRQGDEDEVVRSGKEIVYYAPPPYLVKGQMDDFIEWWNDDRKNLPPIIGSAIGHSIFVIIHPFGDGNGRTARALTEKGMIRNKNEIFRPYALSTFMLRNIGKYYTSLGSINQLDFVSFMLGVYAEALKDGFEKAKSLQFVRYYLGRSNFSKNEQSAIRKMIMFPSPYWDINNLEDIQDYENVWDSLKTRGVIQDNGRFNMEWREKQIYQNEFEPQNNSPKL